jgi:dTDP-4-amino-4,6-dideoxygalactose transaminase
LLPKFSGDCLTLALEGAVSTSGAPEDSEWEIPSWTFAATASAVLRSKMNPIFCDVTDSWRVKPSVSARYVIDVLPFGDEVDFERLGDYEALIVDAAASFDSLKSFFHSGYQKFAMVISLHATKNMPAGEGAVFISNDLEWTRKFKEWSNFGFQTATRESIHVGTNAKLSEYSAAVGLQSLSEWPFDSEIWRNNLNEAQSISNDCKLEVHPAMAKKFITPYWLIRFQNPSMKQKAKNIFTKNLIETRDWWGQGCHKMKAFSHIKKYDLSKTESLSETTLGLPFHKQLSSEDFERIRMSLFELRA